MRRYAFISIPVTRGREGLTLSRDYQQVILDQSAEGWHFVQAISLEHHTNPRLELVFSRKESTS